MLIIFVMLLSFIVAPQIVSIAFAIYALLHFFYIRHWNNMDAEETIKHAYKKDKHVVTIGTVKDGVCSWKVYGKKGKLRQKRLYTYEIASITKTMTGVLVERAVQDEKLCLNDSIDKYIELPSNHTYPTIEELLTHTSGYKSIYVENVMFNNLFKRNNFLRGITRDIIINRIKKNRNHQRQKRMELF